MITINVSYVMSAIIVVMRPIHNAFGIRLVAPAALIIVSRPRSTGSNECKLAMMSLACAGSILSMNRTLR